MLSFLRALIDWDDGAGIEFQRISEIVAQSMLSLLWCSVRCVYVFTQSCPIPVTLGTAAYQAPLLMGFSRQECWSRLPFLPPGDLPDSGIDPASPASPALAGGFFTTEPPGKPFSLLQD